MNCAGRKAQRRPVSWLQAVLRLASHQRYRRLRLLQPEVLVHRAVLLGGRRELALDLLVAADLLVKRAEVEVAVGHQRVHAQLLGQPASRW